MANRKNELNVLPTRDGNSRQQSKTNCRRKTRRINFRNRPFAYAPRRSRVPPPPRRRANFIVRRNRTVSVKLVRWVWSIPTKSRPV